MAGFPQRNHDCAVVARKPRVPGRLGARAALGAAAAVTALLALAPGSAGAAGVPARAKTAAGARPAAHAAASARTRPEGRGKPAATAGGTPLVHDTFKGATADEFTGYDDACLTGAEQLPSGSEPPKGDHALGGCVPPNTAPTTNEEEARYTGQVPPRDAPGHGYLELTNARTHRQGAVLFNDPIEASAGLDLSFESWQYGGNPAHPVPADGISFFLTDGEYDLTAPGGFGGSLGYAQLLDEPGPSNMGRLTRPASRAGTSASGLTCSAVTSPTPSSAGTAARPGKSGLGNLAATTVDQLAGAMRKRLARIQRQPALIAGFLGQAGLTLESRPP